MDAEDIEWVAGPGRGIRVEAQALLADLGSLATVTRLRAEHPDIPAQRISVACSVASTALSHAQKLGPRGGDLVLTDTLAQQATHPAVSTYRAGRLRTLRVTSIVDATAGAGLDSLALHDAGLRVTAIELDDVNHACARANLPDDVRVAHGDATVLAPDLLRASPDSALFVDPARRDSTGPRRGDGGRANAERDPRRWSPPWSWVCEMSKHTPTVAKVAAGIPLGLVPSDATVEWIAIGPDVVEACVWFAPLSDAATRRATAITPDGQATSIDDAVAPPPSAIESPGEFLIEPHDAVRRAGLIDVLASEITAARVGATSMWLTGAQCTTPLARTWRVVDVVPVRDLSTRLRDFARVDFKTSDIDRGSDEIARSVRHRPSPHAAGHIWVAMIRDAAYAVLVQPA